MSLVSYTFTALYALACAPGLDQCTAAGNHVTQAAPRSRPALRRARDADQAPYQRSGSAPNPVATPPRPYLLQGEDSHAGPGGQVTPLRGHLKGNGGGTARSFSAGR